VGAMDPAQRGDASVTIVVNGRPFPARAGMSVAAALMSAEIPCRRSVRGEPRAPLCGMGICFECTANVDGEPLRRTCQILCRDGMKVVTE
jgi:D-hydroxyproline dehydrogenase subunit gamma